MWAFAGSEQALDLADRFADCFHSWSMSFSRDQMDDILDVETGGMLEAFANLYGIMRTQKYLDLIERYTRSRLFRPLLEGVDVLSNMHANTTIPEAHGAARCYEVTGDETWRDIALAYWRCAVTDRGSYATGGQTSGEMWNPPGHLAARRGDKEQEHCSVYNMVRLADYLYRWTGEAHYLDYIERSLYNGVLAQQHSQTGMVASYLPMQPGGKKIWGHPTRDFWCCHGSLVQAHPAIPSLIYYNTNAALTVAQYIPSSLKTDIVGVRVNLKQSLDAQAGDMTVLQRERAAWSGPVGRPMSWLVHIEVAAQPVAFALRLRVPDWVSSKPILTVNGVHTDAQIAAGFVELNRIWHQDTVVIELPKSLRTQSLPDEPGTVAFLDDPLLLAGLTDQEIRLVGDSTKPETILVPDNERAWSNWLPGWRTVGQGTNLRFRPLYEVTDSPYTLYFPVKDFASPAD